jgi:class 3 adenylate cyclase/tetratricopeptide (TPR) repeat protein
MRCPRCQQENPPDALFCQECGVRLEVPCPGCGTGNLPSAKFCNRCGQGLALAPGGEPGPAPPSPATYTPKHLAERILTSRAALEGERKQVTVLFADMKGSMELLADRDPEEARKLLDPVLERMMEAVHRYEGTVNQVMGDGIMALFGAPLAHEDHAVRACYAALRMQESVKKYAEEVRRSHAAVVKIRVGLNSGEVVVRAIGSDLRMDYTAVGQTTHLAARMEQIADPGAIVITPETLALAEGFVQVTSLGPMAVKGLATPVEVYELTGVSVVRSRFQAAATRGFSRFVGRDAEVEQLRRALEQARQGRGQVAAVVGEPGVGKSRLASEVTHSHRVEGWLVLEAGSVSYGKATSYLPVIDLLKGYFRIGDRDTPREIREKVTGKTLTLDRALEATLPALLALLDVAGDDPQWQALDPPQRRQRMLDAVKRLLLREAQVQPLLVVFEDLHWIDSETQELLDSLVESLPPARLLLLVNYRPEYEHRWGSKTSYTQIRLDPLPPESALELLHGLLGEDGTVEPLKSLLIERTEGNPFFMEESVRTLVETKALLGDRGAHRLAQAVTDIQVPPTVQAILASRIDRLAPENKRLLQSAAVIRKDVPFALLAAIADVREDDLRRGLAHLQAAEFLYETSLFPDLEYTFKHALTHDVAYRSLLKERRRELHGRTVEAIERLYSNLLAEHVKRLVYHAVRGEAWEKAATYGARAGTRAADRSAPGQTSKVYFDTALDAVGRPPERRETLEQAIEVRCLLTASLFVLGEREAYLRCMHEALALAERLGDEERLARVLATRTNALWFAGDNLRALESGHRAVTLAEAVGRPTHQIHASLNLGLVCQTVREHHRAVALFARVAELLRDGLERERLGRALYPAVLARNELAASYGQLGKFDSAMAITEEALGIAEALGHSTTLLTARLGSCENLVRRGDFHDAIPRLEVTIQALRDAGLLVWAVSASAMLGYAYAMTGRLREGITLLREAIEQAARGRRTHEARWTAHLCEALLRDGQVAEARELAERALGLARERGERGTEARILYLLGEIFAQSLGQDERAAAERHYVAALALAEQLGMRPLVAHCHLGLGRLYRKTSQLEQAREHLATATTMYRDMDMRFWLEQAGAELKDLK